ncbi:hypothetical protein ACXZ9C_11025 [Streptococcus agalactiae]
MAWRGRRRRRRLVVVASSSRRVVVASSRGVVVVVVVSRRRRRRRRRSVAWRRRCVALSVRHRVELVAARRRFAGWLSVASRWLSVGRRRVASRS